jgi:hypothetical protein
MGRFQGQAANAVRDELEGWLAGISQIENDQPSTAVVPAHRDNDIARFTGLTVAVMGGVRRTNMTLARAADAIRLLADRQSEQSNILASVCEQVEKVAGQQGQVREALARTSTLHAELSALRGEVQKGAQTLALGLSSGFNDLAESVSTARAQTLASVDQLSIRQSDTLRQTLEMAHRVEESARTVEQEGRRGAERLDGQIRPLSDSLARIEGGLAKVDTGVANSSEVQTKRFEQLGSSLVRFHGLISETSAQHQAGLRALEGSVAQVQGVLSDKFDGQIGEVRAVRHDLSSINAMIMKVAAVLDREVAHRSSDELQRSLANNEALDRIAQHQSDIGHILGLLAENLQSNPQAMATILRDAIGAGIQNVTASLQGANGKIVETLDVIASRQASIAESMEKALDVSVLQAELRELSRSIEQGLTSGFKEVSQSFDDTFSSYTDLVRSAQMDVPGEEGLTSSYQLPPEPDAPADLAPYIGELRKIAAKRGPIN